MKDSHELSTLNSQFLQVWNYAKKIKEREEIFVDDSLALWSLTFAPPQSSRLGVMPQGLTSPRMKALPFVHIP